MSETSRAKEKVRTKNDEGEEKIKKEITLDIDTDAVVNSPAWASREGCEELESVRRLGCERVRAVRRGGRDRRQSEGL